MDTLPSTGTPTDTWVIEPRQDGFAARLRDFWRYRNLLRFFASKAVAKMYRRTVLGSTWIFIRPLFPLAVNTIVFGGVLGVGSHGVPYFLFLTTGHALWDLFASSLMWGTRSLELNRGFLTKIYVPRLIMPVSSMTPAYVNFAINLGVLACAQLYYFVTTGMIYFTPAKFGWALLALVMSSILSLGLSLWTSVPALQARDIRFSLGYVLSLWVFLTPVLYPLTLPARFAKYAWMMSLNPMAAIVNAFKYGVLGLPVLNVRDLAIAGVMTLVVFFGGLAFFGRAEGTAADKV